MAQSILTSIKKVIGVVESDTSFDLDIVMHINSVFSVLDDLGVGPVGGFMIEDSTATWDDFLPVADPRMNMVKSYMYLKVRLHFDMPTTSFAIQSMEKMATEYEWRLNAKREETQWTDPFPVEPIVA